MVESAWSSLVNALRGAEYRLGIVTPEPPAHRVAFDRGLTDTEVEAVQSRFGFRFPTDLRAFLQTALPRGPGFPDWRSSDHETLREWLDGPRRGVLFDVEHDSFWHDAWGPRPARVEDALAVATAQIRAAPRLIPVFVHRMMPDEPESAGNPVLSVHQTDVIVYGADLAEYLRREFGLQPLDEPPSTARPIRFWDLLCS